jgi:hypothetical protein
MMKRRDFLKQSGTGLAALAAVPVVIAAEPVIRNGYMQDLSLKQDTFTVTKSTGTVKWYNGYDVFHV